LPWVGFGTIRVEEIHSLIITRTRRVAAEMVRLRSFDGELELLAEALLEQVALSPRAPDLELRVAGDGEHQLDALVGDAAAHIRDPLRAPAIEPVRHPQDRRQEAHAPLHLRRELAEGLVALLRRG